MQTIEVLGFSVNSLSRELSLPAVKIKKIRAETCTLLASSQVPLRKLSQLLGKLQPAARAVHLAPLFSTSLHKPQQALRWGLFSTSLAFSKAVLTRARQQGVTLVLIAPVWR